MEIKISQDDRSKIMNSLFPGLYPKKMHFLALNSNLVFIVVNMAAKHKEPKVLRNERSGNFS